MTPAQCKMARAGLGVSVRDLAELAKVSTNTITRLEAGEDLKPRTIDAVRKALEAAGCIFIEENGEGPGVRLKKLPGGQRQAISQEIETLEAKIADMPEGGEASPEGGMNTMRKAVAENDLVHLKSRRRKSEQK